MNTTKPLALVTGTSRGLGRALASELVERGWRVMGTARDAAALAAVAAELGDSFHPVPGDQADPEHRARLAAGAGALGGLDLVVLNAGSLGPSPLPAVMDLDPDALGALFAANVVAPVALLRTVAPHLRAGAAVAGLTSDAAAEAYPGWGGYGATKAALERLLAVLAAERRDLRVLAVDPGDVRTAMHQAAFPGEDISDRPLPEAVVPALLDRLLDPAVAGRVRITVEVEA